MEGFATTLVPINKADEQGSFANATMQLLKNLDCFGNKTRLENKILRRIPSEREFRCQNQLSALLRKAGVRAQNLLGITL